MDIIFDFDNTIANSTKAIHTIYQKITDDYSTKVTDLRSWDLTDICPRWDKDTINSLFSARYFFDVLEPIEGMIELMKELHEERHKIIICTCHEPDGIPFKDKWIQQNIPFVDEVIYIRLKSKLGKANATGDIIIDDSLDALNSSKVRYKICFGNYAYNQDWNGIRADNSELLKHYIKAINDIEER